MRWVGPTIALVGHMGSGKSTIGKALARRLDLSFVDSDDEVERVAGKPVARIFADDGEDAFRALERDTILALLDERPHVLATGGGAITDLRVRDALKAGAMTIWLRTDPALLARRLSWSDKRPLLHGRDAGSVIARLAPEREPLYAGADLVIDTDSGKSATIRSILEALAEFKRS